MYFLYNIFSITDVITYNLMLLLYKLIINNNKYTKFDILNHDISIIHDIIIINLQLPRNTIKRIILKSLILLLSIVYMCE